MVLQCWCSGKGDNKSHVTTYFSQICLQKHEDIWPAETNSHVSQCHSYNSMHNVGFTNGTVFRWEMQTPTSSERHKHPQTVRALIQVAPTALS